MNSKMHRRPLAILLTILSLAASSLPVRADPAADETAIRNRLQDWATAFNARDAVKACDLFAPDLIYSVPEIAEGSQTTMCSNLARVLARQNVQLRYDDPDIHEVMLDGDIAIVRLTWRLTAKSADETDRTIEEGMDVFRRQPDGRWSIARFVAFAPQPDAKPE